MQVSISIHLQPGEEFDHDLHKAGLRVLKTFKLPVAENEIIVSVHRPVLYGHAGTPPPTPPQLGGTDE